MSHPYPIVVLVSGTGSNLQSLIDATHAGTLDVGIAGVIANRPAAHALKRAQAARIPTRVIDHKAHDHRAAFDAALGAAIDAFAPRLIVLAGFMRRLTGAFVDRYTGRMINLHPSLLPAYRGLHTHERCLADGVTQTGTSLHFVTPELDGGPVIARARVAVEPGDTPESLKQRVQRREHVLLPRTVALFSQDRIRLAEAGVRFDGNRLAGPLTLNDNDELQPDT